jgi:Fibronectin type III domain.
MKTVSGSAIPLTLRCAAALLALSASNLIGDETWTYSVQISATVQPSPPQITLHWENNDIYGVTNFTIYRKAKNATSWNLLTNLNGSTFSWTDPNVSVGSTYEYQIVKGASGHVGYGYIYTGINAALIENRGKLLLMVATNGLDTLSNELVRLQSDITGDGWQVIRQNVSSNDTPANVKSLIVSDYNADPANVQAVFLFGHVPILQSGFLDYDTHGARPMATDCYYADIDGDWSTSPSYLPSDVELMVSRVDLANMPGSAAPGVLTNEVELLRNYLNKDHRWRHKLFTVPRRALMADRFGDLSGEARSATGYRNFEPMVGPGNTFLANVSDSSLPTNCWLSLISSNSYLWTYACGGGQDTTMSAMGTHGQYFDAWSTDIVSRDVKAVFFMLEGSWMGNWDHTDNFLRSVLATPTMGLACCCIAGHPHAFYHHMGLGEPIGYGIRLSMNNSTLYRNQSNDFARAIYIELLGDPTLRLDQLAPPSNLSATINGTSVALNWSSSTDSVAGYHVYRATSSAGPFTRVTSSLLTGTIFTDLSVPAGSYTYMVRAVALQTNPSGSYYNPSQGVFATASVTASIPPITVTASRLANGIKLTWNTQPGTVYRVLAKTSASQPNWTDLSGSINATSATTSWSDNNMGTVPSRLYRVASP